MIHALPFLAEITLTEGQVGGGIAAGIAGLLGSYFVITKFIREQAGVTQPQAVEVTGQPIRTQREVRYATHEELEQVRKDVEDLRSEVREDVKGIHQHITARFDHLNQDRRVSVANLHEKLDEHEKRDAERTSMIMEKIGELRGGQKK